MSRKHLSMDDLNSVTGGEISRIDEQKFYDKLEKMDSDEAAFDYVRVYMDLARNNIAFLQLFISVSRAFFSRVGSNNKYYLQKLNWEINFLFGDMKQDVINTILKG